MERKEIALKRSPGHYIVTLLVPMCFLVLIDFASMFIAMDGGERLGFKITLVLGFSVLLLMLNDILPSSQGTPILEVFCLTCLILMITSIANAVFIAYLLQQPETRPMPKWLKIGVLKYLVTALGMETRDGEAGIEVKETTSLLSKKSDSTEAELLKLVLKEMSKIKALMRSTSNGRSTSQWYRAAFILDRFFFILYLIGLAITACVVVCVWLV